jgi:hypothetical protein
MNKTHKIPCAPFTLHLSSWDKMWPPIHSRRILCFSLPSDADREAVVSDLFAGLKRTVDELPWLAGSVAQLSTQEEGAPPWHWTIAPKGDCRMIVKDLSDTIDYATLRENHFAQKLLDTDTLCPLPQVLHITDEVVPVCRIQANFVRGGLLLVISIPHVATDGQAITEIIERFTRHVRHVSLGERSPPGTREDHMDRRALVFGHGPGVIDRHSAWTAYPGGMSMGLPPAGRLPTVATCHTFRFSPANLAALKDMALADAGALSPSGAPLALWLSSHDAVSALFFSRMAQARRRAGVVTDNTPVHFVVPVDCRARLGLPVPYHGNAIYNAEIELSFADLDGPHALGHVATALRARFAALTGADVQDVIAFVEREGHAVQLSAFANASTHTIMLTSHWRFGMHALDFGPRLGHIDAFRLPATGMVPGLHIVLPRLPDGGCEIMVSESEGAIVELMKDPEWVRFAVLME